MPNFIKVETNCNFETKSAPVQDPRFSNIIFKLDLLRVPIFIALTIYFIFGTKFAWNEGIDTCFNVECVLLGRNFDFLVVTWWVLLVA